MVGHVRHETVETTSPVPKTQPFCPWGGYTSGPEHHIHTIQPISITRALHAFKWNRHDRQICVITVTRSKLHMHAPSATIKRASSIQLTHWSGLSFTSRSTLIWRKQRQQNVSIVHAKAQTCGTSPFHSVLACTGHESHEQMKQHDSGIVIGMTASIQAAAAPRERLHAPRRPGHARKKWTLCFVIW